MILGFYDCVIAYADLLSASPCTSGLGLRHPNAYKGISFSFSPSLVFAPEVCAVLARQAPYPLMPPHPTSSQELVSLH